eukprot:3427566-Pyramimonas_sp.AAC.1
MSVKRIGWRMRDFATLLDRRGTAVSLTYVSPTLLKDLLRRAVVRDLERSIAVKLEVPWDRVCFAIVKSEARKKTLHTNGKRSYS